jgi:rSAM/selenodomain-associated transferase 2
MTTVSVIVPALNEEARVPGLMRELRALGPDELILVDGGSGDRTAELAAPHATVLRSAAGRALQMNTGAHAASGEVLLFLHADARLEPTGLKALRDAMADPAVSGGTFDIRYEGGDMAAGAFTRFNRVRRRCGIFYGDAGIFCRRDLFHRLGGYREWPIMEDYEFARRLWKSGRLALLGEPIWISDRRWRRGGMARTLWNWFLIQSLYYARVSPQRLARFYPHIR